MFDRNLWDQAKSKSFYLWLTVFFGGLLGGLIAAQAFLISRVIANIFLDGDTLVDVQSDLIWLLILIILRGGLAFGREVAAGHLSVSIRSTLREKIFKHMLDLGPSVLEKEQVGELVNTLGQGIEGLDAYFRHYLPQLALSALVPLLILVIVFPLDWVTGLVFLLTAPLIPLFMLLIARHAEKETERQWKLLSRLSAHFHDVLRGLTTLKNFGRSKDQAESIRHSSERYADATLRVLRIAFLSALVLELLATISTAIVAVQIGLRLLYAQMSFGDALFILILAPEFYFPLRQLGASFHAGMEGISAAVRIFEIQSIPLPKPGSRKQFSLEAGIEFSQVHHSYSRKNLHAIQDVSFRLEPHTTTALVGTSGAGKSTLAGLLAGFLVPDSGEILVGEHPLRDLDLISWREKVAWVSQFPYMFHTTIEENIRLSKPEASQDEIVAAARTANADAFIRSFPDGYRTVVGERGMRLSGGQVQRIALARAFLKNAPVLIMDEPGANLDPESQDLLVDALRHLLIQRTSLIIAHRLSTIRNADQVVVVEKGRVVQNGTPEELLHEGGHLERLITASGGAG